jgi:hypothetical protein
MFSAREIWTMRQRGDFWIAMPWARTRWIPNLPSSPMDDHLLRRWEVKRTPDSDWAELPGRYTTREIAAMRAKRDFWVARPVREHEDAAIER